jgi:predicted AAA+ superfamily ATPase
LRLPSLAILNEALYVIPPSTLTGRYIQFQILPPSFSEFLRVRDFAVDETLSLKERQGMVLNLLDE